VSYRVHDKQAWTFSSGPGCGSFLPILLGCVSEEQDIHWWRELKPQAHHLNGNAVIGGKRNIGV
jgi:hypothetical protein